MDRRWRAAKRRRASATIEYALFLTLVAAGIVLAADTVSYAMRGSFDHTSLALHGDFNARHLPLGDLKPEVDLVASIVAPGDGSPVRMYQYASVAGSLLCGALVWYGLYCKRTGLPPETAHDVTEQLHELPPELSHDELFNKRQQILRILATDMAALLESRLEVRHLMSRRLKTVKQQTPREELAALMEEHTLRHLLVCDESDKLVGLVSDRDLVSRQGSTAQALMTTNLVTVEPQAQVNPAITLLINKQISCLPVVVDGAPIGVLTTTDLMMALQCSMQLLKKVAGEVQRPQIENAPKSISRLAATSPTDMP